MTNWIALIILALGAVLLILNESGMIAGLDTATFGYVAMFSALIVYLSGGTATKGAGTPWCATC